MQRYFIELSYNGKNYFGWQKQPEQISVQEEIETCLTKLNSNNEVAVVGCGRTDTGVHAQHYILHVDLPSMEQPNQLVYKLNKMLPQDIAIHRIIPVEHIAHARFDAKKRTYRYFIHFKKDPFLSDQSWYYPHPIDFEKMNLAAQHLLGKQDFTSLSKLHTDVKTNICEVFSAQWVQQNEEQYYFEISADRFLRNMVRATVGTLLEVGLGKITGENLLEILDAKDRGAAATSVPAHGLFLWKVEY